MKKPHFYFLGFILHPVPFIPTLVAVIGVLAVLVWSIPSTNDAVKPRVPGLDDRPATETQQAVGPKEAEPSATLP